MTIYGYCRISTRHQSIDRQIRNIKEAYPEATILKEAYSGISLDRPEWLKLKKIIKPGDTIVFDSVSRMSRSSDEGFNEYKNLYDNDVNLVFLKEPHINTSVYREALKKQINMTGDKVDLILEGINKYLMAIAEEQIKIAFDQSEKEVQDLHKRTSEGLLTAKLNGKQIGQKPGNKLTIKKEDPIKEIIRSKSKDFDGTLNDVELMALLSGLTIKVQDGSTIKEVSAKLSRNTYYKYKGSI